MTPKLKTIADEKKIPIFLPKKSATGAAVSAPRNVPSERMETISDSSLGSTAGSPSASVYPLEKLSTGQQAVFLWQHEAVLKPVQLLEKSSLAPLSTPFTRKTTHSLSQYGIARIPDMVPVS